MNELKTTAEDRVLIAKDVIARLDAETMIARGDLGTLRMGGDEDALWPYVYFSGISDIWRDSEKKAEALDARELLKDKQCNVCAKGALLVSTIDRFNKVKLGELTWGDADSLFVVDSDHPSKMWLIDYFDAGQLVLMEAAFEGSDISDDILSYKLSYKVQHLECDDYDELYDEFDEDVDEDVEPELSPKMKALHDAYEYATKYSDPTTRLRAIMENVVANKGEFIPEKSQQ